MAILNHHLRAAVAAFALAAGLAACGGSGQVSLAALAGNQYAYIGKEVTTSGRVEEQTNPDGSHYYVLGDAAQNLVVLVPFGRARRFKGQNVSATGRVGFNPHEGRLIRIARISLQP